MEVVDGDPLSLGDDVSIKVVETPGHSIGSVTFVLDGLDWAFAADACKCMVVRVGFQRLKSQSYIVKVYSFF